MSARIRARLTASRKRFFENDFISEFVETGELDELLSEVVEYFKAVLARLVIDTEGYHNTHYN
ncbi:MAG: GTP cyclohydrolase I, partial [Phenylobacterium sp.]